MAEGCSLTGFFTASLAQEVPLSVELTQPDLTLSQMEIRLSLHRIRDTPRAAPISPSAVLNPIDGSEQELLPTGQPTGPAHRARAPPSCAPARVPEQG